MNKKAIDNRANQLNPNNAAYWSSRQGNHGKATKNRYNSSYPSAPSSSNRYTPKFVSAPPKKGLFGRSKGGEYGWVICDHVGKFLTSTSNTYWSTEFEKAVVFDNEKDAEVISQLMRKSEEIGDSRLLLGEGGKVNFFL